MAPTWGLIFSLKETILNSSYMVISWNPIGHLRSATNGHKCETGECVSAPAIVR